MIRSLLRSCGRFVAAVVLLVLLVCAVEVGLRANRLRLATAPGTQSQSINVVVPSQTSYLEVLPLQDWSIETESGEKKECRTNELGLRGASVTVPKPENVLRILCCGSDDTFGVGVGQQYVFCARLEDFLQPLTTRKVEVLNAGCPQAGLLVNYLQLRNRFSGLQPDVIVLNFNVDDIYRDQMVRGTLRVDERQRPAFAIHPTLKAKGSKFVDQACDEFIIADWMIDHMGGLIGVNAPRSERAMVTLMEQRPQQFEPVFLTHELAVSLNAQLLLSLTPSPWSMQKPAEDGSVTTASTLSRDLTLAMQQTGLARAIPLNDSSDLFQRSPHLKELFSPHSGLLSPRGHDLYARSLARFIVQQIPGVWDAPVTTSQTAPAPTGNPFLQNAPLSEETGVSPISTEPAAPNTPLRPLPRAERQPRPRF